MKRVSLQDIFNAAWQKFILEDNPPAVDEFGTCVYLTDDGRKCAVGLCIPDGHPYQQEVMGFATLMYNDRISSQPLFDEQIHSMTSDQLNDFQLRLHDDLKKDGQWSKGQEDRRVEYIKVSYDFGLTIPGEPV